MPHFSAVQAPALSEGSLADTTKSSSSISQLDATREAPTSRSAYLQLLVLLLSVATLVAMGLCIFLSQSKRSKRTRAAQQYDLDFATNEAEPWFESQIYIEDDDVSCDCKCHAVDLTRSQPSILNMSNK